MCRKVRSVRHGVDRLLHLPNGTCEGGRREGVRVIEPRQPLADDAVCALLDQRVQVLLEEALADVGARLAVERIADCGPLASRNYFSFIKNIKNIYFIF